MKPSMLLLLLPVVLIACAGQPPAPPAVEPPRRLFEPVPTAQRTPLEPFVVDESYAHADLEISANSRSYSTALLLADLGILDKVSPDTFASYSQAFFGRLPTGGTSKEIAVPRLSSYQPKAEEATRVELDGCFFVSEYTDSAGNKGYRVETNLPIDSVYQKSYDGYMIAADRECYKGKVPARWTAIMNVAVANGRVIYQGVAYPKMAAPLVFTGTGIGPDGKMARIASPGADIQAVIRELNDVVGPATSAPQPNEADEASRRLLQRYAYLSTAAYQYIDGHTEQSARDLESAMAVHVALPEDARGLQCKEIERILRVLHSLPRAD